MAKYSRKSSEKVEKAIHEMHEGKLRSGRSGKKVTSTKQAIAIGLSEARAEGAKVPKKAAKKKATTKKSSTGKTAAKKKAATKKTAG
jgi:topoisomerase IA-like protein